MKKRIAILLLMFNVALNTPLVIADDVKSYIVMQNDLKDIKADFNEAVDQVRLVFIVGPT